MSDQPLKTQSRKNNRWILSLRFKLLLLSISVLSLPYVGYQYVREMEHYLRQGLESSLMSSAGSVAGLLSGRQVLFPDVSDAVDAPVPLFVHSMKQVIQIDGYDEEWKNFLEWADVYRSDLSSDPLAVKLVAAEQGRYLYMLIHVEDPQRVYLKPNKPFAGESDQIELLYKDHKNLLQQIWIAPAAPGKVTAYTQRFVWNEEFWENTPVVQTVNNITGNWQETTSGYVLEIQIPHHLIDRTLGVRITDNDRTPSTQSVPVQVATFNPQRPDQPNTLVWPSNTIENMIAQIEITEGRRTWVLDVAGNVLATRGNLKDRKISSPVNRLYSLILPSITRQFKDDMAGASRLRGEEVESALAGNSTVSWRSSPDEKAVIVSAASPVRSGDAVIGVVVTEETTGNIQTVQRQAMADLFTRSILLFTLVTLLLLLFSSRLSRRIQRLSREADMAIDSHGKVISTSVGAPWRDELGDLSIRYSEMLERLKQYNDYLESLASKLSHELRTPMAVVRSSLDNIEASSTQEESQLYIERAKQGTDRLLTLVTRLSEASRLEQALKTTEFEVIEPNKLLAGCVEGYRLAYPQNRFELQQNLSGEQLICAPDLIVQMLDKLVSNAIDFSENDQAINLKISEKEANWQIQVINKGSLLPEGFEGNLFSSMISMRENDNCSESEPHLGLGLYIASLIAEYHDGSLQAENLKSGDGVVFTVTLPVYR